MAIDPITQLGGGEKSDWQSSIICCTKGEQDSATPGLGKFRAHSIDLANVTPRHSRSSVPTPPYPIMHELRLSTPFAPFILRLCRCYEHPDIYTRGLRSPKRLGRSATCCCWTATTLTGMLSKPMLFNMSLVSWSTSSIPLSLFCAKSSAETSGTY